MQRKYTFPRYHMWFNVFWNWLRFMYMLTESLSSTIHYSWHSSLSKPVIKNSKLILPCQSHKKYSKKKPTAVSKNRNFFGQTFKQIKQIWSNRSLHITLTFFFYDYHGKHLCQSLFLNEVRGWRAATFKKNPPQVFL